MTVHFDSVETTGDVKFKAGTKSVLRPRTAYRIVGKRLFDVIAVVAASPILVPLAAVMAAIILLSGYRPFYVQERLGRDGRVFRMWKFRTMVEDAEAVLENYLHENPSARAEWDAHQKLKSDPRITIVGRFLRKTSLDELPQFWNVLIGEMSIVGPRPMTVGQKSLYPGDAYYRMRPGLTGLWQISERNDAEFRERAYFDAEYELVMSLGVDLRVLSRTVGVVVQGTGY
jgi:exopolysaccharide production protein ExoY